MTLIEKFTIESSAAACDSATVVLQDVVSIFNLLSANLPNLSVRDRSDLQNEASNRLKIAQEMRSTATKLRAMITGR